MRKPPLHKAMREDLSEEKHLTEILKTERSHYTMTWGIPRTESSKYKSHDGGGMSLTYLKRFEEDPGPGV